MSLERIAANVKEVRDRISAAAQRGGRSDEEITLVAVTKYIDAEQTRLVVEAGCVDLGENRPQQLWDKAESLEDLASVRWHQIGHLQRNKVARTVPIISLLHSVDSLRLLKEVDKFSAVVGSPLPVLLEVNVSGDESKHGWQVAEMPAVVETALGYANIEVRGLMTMATLGGNADVVRRDFSELRKLRDKLQAIVGSEATLHELSMGMSGDYEIAIEEGATIVRVGSALLK